MADNDPAALIKRLAERLREEAGHAGLTLRGFSFVPNLDGDGPDMVQAAFTLDGDLLPDPTQPAQPDQAAIDAEFARMMGAQTLADKVSDARDTLRRRLESGDLLGDDDDGEPA